MMVVYEENNNVYVKNFDNLNLKKTLNCGQCFRWEEINDNEFIGILNEKIIHLKKDDDTLIFYNINIEYFNKVIFEYFAFDEDYEIILKKINTDPHMEKTINYASGIRILKQDLFETIISFIISSNNNIKRITKNLNDFSKAFGKEIKYMDKVYYTFPKINDIKHLKKEDLALIKLGYRDEYILDFISKIINNEIDLEKIKTLDTKSAKEELMKIKGVGNKVADCILLFSLKRYELSPLDVWMKKVLENRYNIKDVDFKKSENFVKDKWGNYAGIAQQYLFFYEREN